jgi:hypothetical protein
MKVSKLTKGKLKSSTGGQSAATGIASPPPRVPPTTPLAIFKRSLERAKNLLIIHGRVHGSVSRPPAMFADMHRASIVLAVSALDAYIRTLVVDKVITMLKDVSKIVPTNLRDQLKNLMNQDELFDAARIGDLPSRVEKALKDKFEESSFQGVEKITSVMKLIGKKDVFKDIARSASLNEQELKENLARFTKRRHIIAHCGDYDLTQTPPAENSITKHDVEECIKIMQTIAHEIEKVI